jgi:hypothetical protein
MVTKCTVKSGTKKANSTGAEYDVNCKKNGANAGNTGNATTVNATTVNATTVNATAVNAAALNAQIAEAKTSVGKAKLTTNSVSPENPLNAIIRNMDDALKTMEEEVQKIKSATNNNNKVQAKGRFNAAYATFKAAEIKFKSTKVTPTGASLNGTADSAAALSAAASSSASAAVPAPVALATPAELSAVAVTAPAASSDNMNAFIKAMEGNIDLIDVSNLRSAWDKLSPEEKTTAKNTNIIPLSLKDTITTWPMSGGRRTRSLRKNRRTHSKGKRTKRNKRNKRSKHTKRKNTK